MHVHFAKHGIPFNYSGIRPREGILCKFQLLVEINEFVSYAFE